MSKFYYGDKVIYRAKNAVIRDVIKPKEKGGTTSYKIEIDLPNQKTREEIVEETEIKNYKQRSEKCPVCYTPWVITEFNVKKWKDCLKCHKTEEEILRTKSQTNSVYGYMNMDDDFGTFHSD
jgi:nitrate reductase cytochrome c-type subunit